MGTNGLFINVSYIRGTVYISVYEMVIMRGKNGLLDGAALLRCVELDPRLTCNHEVETALVSFA